MVLNWASHGPSENAPTGPHLDLVILAPPWATSGHGSTAWPAGWPHLDLVSGVATWASPIMVTEKPTWASLGPGESGPYLVLTRNWYLWSPPGNHMGPVKLVPIWASPSPGDFVPHLDLIAVDSFWPHLELVTLNLTGPHPDPVTLVLTCGPL